MGMVFQSSRHQPSQNQANTTTREISEGHKPEPFTVDWLTHDGVVFFTFLLVVVAGMQAALFLWQLRYMKDGLSDAKTAADAAESNASATKSLAEATRAGLLPMVSFTEVVLTIKAFDPSLILSTGHGAAKKITDKIPPRATDAAIGFKNLGQTPAVITNLCVEYIVCDELSEGPTYSHWVTPNYSIGREQEAHIIASECPIKLTSAQLADLGSSKAKLWLYGVVTYRDVFADQWQMGFLVVWKTRDTEHSGFDWAHDTRFVYFRKKPA